MSGNDPARHARALAQAALDRKAEDLVVLDLRGLANFTDFFVLATGTNPRHNRAVAEAVRERGKAEGLARLGEEDSADQSWILVDYGSVVVHVFLPDTRQYYGIEYLWQDAPRLATDGGAQAPPAAAGG